MVLLEYGNIIWDNCSKEQSDLIESIQLDAARIVTGLRKGTPKWKLYNELGWDSLQNRRWKNKLLFLHKAIPGNIPDYIAADVRGHLQPLSVVLHVIKIAIFLILLINGIHLMMI